MTRWLRYSVVVLGLLGVTTVLLESAEASERKAPRVDDRVAIESVAEDRVEVTAPYMFDQSAHGADINTLAKWACGLYQREAVWLSYRISDTRCDQMGAEAAKRDPGCWDIHLYACALP